MNIVHLYTKAMKNWKPEEIKKFRQRLSLYQKDFATLIGVTMRYVIYLEKGVRQPSMTLKILLTILEEQENEKGKEIKNHGKRKLS